MKRLGLLLMLTIGLTFCGCMHSDRYTLSVETYSLGYVPQSETSYPKGHIVTLTPIPYSNYVFAGWDGPDVLDVVDNKITMDGDKVLIARFVPVVSLAVDKKAGNLPHTISCHLEFAASDIVSIEWAFGDGTTQVGSPDATHTYAGPGVYKVQVLCKNGAGSTYQASAQVVVFSGSLSLDSEAEGIYVSGSYAFVAAGDDGLRIANISVPSHPMWMSRYDTPSHSYDVMVEGNYAYLADGLGGLKVLDISNPSAPKLKSHVSGAMARSVHINGNYAFVADQWRYFHIYSIADPMIGPKLLKSVPVSSEAISVLENQGRLYVTRAFPYSTAIYDVSNPLSPRSLSSFPGESRQAFVCGQYAYLAGDGLQVFDVSNAASPVKVGCSLSSFQAFYVFVKDNYAYVAGLSFLNAYDVSDPANPAILGSLDSPDFITSIYVEAGALFITSPDGIRYLPYDFWLHPYDRIGH